MMNKPWHKYFFLISGYSFLIEFIFDHTTRMTLLSQAQWQAPWSLSPTFSHLVFPYFFYIFATGILWIFFSKRELFVFGAIWISLAVTMSNSLGYANHSRNVFFYAALGLALSTLPLFKRQALLLMYTAASSIYVSSGIWKLYYLLPGLNWEKFQNALPDQLALAYVLNGNLSTDWIHFFKTHPALSGALWAVVIALLIGLPLLSIYKNKFIPLSVLFFIGYHVNNLVIMRIGFNHTILFWIFFLVVYARENKSAIYSRGIRS